MRARAEAALALGAYGLYLGVRRIVFTEKGKLRADRNAVAIARLEERLGIAVERDLQDLALRASPRLVDGLNVGYAAGNVALSVVWLIVLLRRGDPRFTVERTAALVAFCGALPVFLAFPTAPPRRQAGHVDTLASRGIDLDHPVLLRFYNPIAAMPSHHMAFAVVTGLGFADGASGPLARGAWRMYPLAVATTVVATGNHYILDVVAGLALGALARWLTR